MKEVSEFEARLLRILRCLMHRTSVEQSLSLFVQSVPRPRCLSRHCVELVQDGLSKGVTEWLARSGYLSSQFCEHETVSSGRLWQRHPPEALSLTFSRNSMELLIWLTSENLTAPASSVAIDADSATTGDRIVALMTFAVLRSTLGAPVLMKQPLFEDHGLIALMFPDSVAVMAEDCPLDLNSWLQKDCYWIMEALQSKLAQRWCGIENFKRSLSNLDDLQKIGHLQSVVLAKLLDLSEHVGRKDLCLFLLKAAKLLFQNVSVDRWYDCLDLRLLRMSERAEIYRSALAFFRGIERLHRWHLQSQEVGFYDEDYRACQLWKSEWERLGGDQVHERTERIIELVDPLRTASTT
ncbi:MAG: hypothetical protein U0936_01495 [Planctomycetaceae bacterium]